MTAHMASGESAASTPPPWTTNWRLSPTVKGGEGAKISNHGAVFSARRARQPRSGRLERTVDVGDQRRNRGLRDQVANEQRTVVHDARSEGPAPRAGAVDLG